MRLLTVALTLALVTSGCAPRRTFKIVSDPPGATIRLDDETIGVTPLELRFYHYGIRRVTLAKEGYRTHSEEVKLDDEPSPYSPRLSWKTRKARLGRSFALLLGGVVEKRWKASVVALSLMAVISMSAVPFSIQCASTLPRPPPVMIPTEFRPAATK